MIENSHEQSHHYILSALGWPLFFVTLSIFIWAGFQVTEVIQDRHNLTKAFEAQEQQLQQGQKVGNMLESLVVGLNTLDKQGNQNAKDILSDLNKAGIKINLKDPNQASASPVDGAAHPAMTPAPAP